MPTLADPAYVRQSQAYLRLRQHWRRDPVVYVRQRFGVEPTWQQRQILAHSIEFSGGVGHCSSKASRREDLEIEQPVACWDCSSFHFHPTLASMLGATLIRYQIVEVR
jgi:hypothetical protein